MICYGMLWYVMLCYVKLLWYVKFCRYVCRYVGISLSLSRCQNWHYAAVYLNEQWSVERLGLNMPSTCTQQFLPDSRHFRLIAAMGKLFVVTVATKFHWYHPTSGPTSLQKDSKVGPSPQPGRQVLAVAVSILFSSGFAGPHAFGNSLKPQLQCWETQYGQWLETHKKLQSEEAEEA